MTSAFHWSQADIPSLLKELNECWCGIAEASCQFLVISLNPRAVNN